MWSVDEVIEILAKGIVPKRKVAEYIKLERPYTRIQREEFAEITCNEANRNEKLSKWLYHEREQYWARIEYEDLYFEEHNTLPSLLVRGKVVKHDWVEKLNEYKQQLNQKKDKSNDHY